MRRLMVIEGGLTRPGCIKNGIHNLLWSDDGESGETFNFMP